MVLKESIECFHHVVPDEVVDDFINVNLFIFILNPKKNSLLQTKP